MRCDKSSASLPEERWCVSVCVRERQRGMVGFNASNSNKPRYDSPTHLNLKALSQLSTPHRVWTVSNRLRERERAHDTLSCCLVFWF